MWWDTRVLGAHWKSMPQKEMLHYHLPLSSFKTARCWAKVLIFVIAVTLEALLLKLVQSKIYHSLNVTFWIVCEITAEALKVEQARWDITLQSDVDENYGTNHFHINQAGRRHKYHKVLLHMFMFCWEAAMKVKITKNSTGQTQSSDSGSFSHCAHCSISHFHLQAGGSKC